MHRLLRRLTKKPVQESNWNDIGGVVLYDLTVKNPGGDRLPTELNVSILIRYGIGNMKIGQNGSPFLRMA